MAKNTWSWRAYIIAFKRSLLLVHSEPWMGSSSVTVLTRQICITLHVLHLCIQPSQLHPHPLLQYCLYLFPGGRNQVEALGTHWLPLKTTRRSTKRQDLVYFPLDWFMLIKKNRYNMCMMKKKKKKNPSQIPSQFFVFTLIICPWQWTDADSNRCIAVVLQSPQSTPPPSSTPS